MFKDHEARFTVCYAKVFRFALVNSDISRQMGGHSTLLTVTPHYSVVKYRIRTEVVEVLEEASDE